MRDGAICYLDEVVEARQDTTVVLHPLSDHRRQLPIERLGETLDAAPGFCLVVSYNPGYQSVLKDLKDSTRQRMVAIDFGFPTPDVEEKILVNEAGIGHERAAELVQLGQAIRRLETGGLREVASTRVLIAAGQLIAEGLSPRDAARAAIAGPLTDDSTRDPRSRRNDRRISGRRTTHRLTRRTPTEVACRTRAPQSRSRSAT